MTWLNQVSAVVKLEARKYSKQKSTKIIFALYLLSLAVLVGVFWLGSVRLNLMVLSTRQLMSISLTWTMALLLPFAAVYLTGSSFQKEFTSGTIKNLMLLPVNRNVLYWGKIASSGLALGTLLAVQYLFTGIFSLIVTLSSLGLTGAAFVNFMSGMTDGLLRYGGAACILMLIVLISSGIALTVKNMGLVLVISYLGYMAAGLLTFWWPNWASISFAELISNYSNILRQLSISQLFVLLAYYTIGACAGYFLFEKKEAMVCPFE